MPSLGGGSFNKRGGGALVIVEANPNLKATFSKVVREILFLIPIIPYELKFLWF